MSIHVYRRARSQCSTAARLVFVDPIVDAGNFPTMVGVSIVMNASRLPTSPARLSHRALVIAVSVVASAGVITASSVAGAGINDTTEDVTVDVAPTLADPIVEPIDSAPLPPITDDMIAPEPDDTIAPEPGDTVDADNFEDMQPVDWDDCPGCGLG
jgi:hypothetical protein